MSPRRRDQVGAVREFARTDLPRLSTDMHGAELGDRSRFDAREGEQARRDGLKSLVVLVSGEPEPRWAIGWHWIVLACTAVGRDDGKVERLRFRGDVDDPVCCAESESLVVLALDALVGPDDHSLDVLRDAKAEYFERLPSPETATTAAVESPAFVSARLDSPELEVFLNRSAFASYCECWSSRIRAQAVSVAWRLAIQSRRTPL
ncbi:MAG: hypothetical protein IPG46_13555 [Actinobacteria bacterium]|nr:hypothetical protein [Actinomycetota bacterium]